MTIFSLDEDKIEEEHWELPSDFDLFAKHKARKVFYPSYDGTPSTRYFNIECIEPDSPLDILNKDTSTHEYDATGHCVWAGAFLLISCIRELNCFSLGGKRMIELGSGTGIGGLAVMLSNANEQQKPSHVCFTDNDPAVLKVCKRNCDLNHLPEDTYTIEELTWGHEETSDQMELFDIALATDVLYDVDLIEPLFTSVARMISSEGLFILSHIPRACYNEGNPPEAVEDLEKYIIDQAAVYGFCLDRIIHPPSEDQIAAETLEWCPRDAFCQGAILVFRTRRD
eukprot:scaffold4897_cov272-Chaetoceros_neogracile.AAC.3